MSRKPDTYTQVHLLEVRDGEGPPRRDDAWIPTEFARAGGVVLIDGARWTVLEVYSTRPAEWVLANEREWRRVPTSDAENL